MRSRYRRKSSIDYILPFLLIVGLGIVCVLGYQLYSKWNEQGQADAYFYVAQGKAERLLYGQSQWDPAFSGTKFLLGDSLKTSTVGKLVINFWNGTIIRLGDDSIVSLKDLKKAADSEKIAINLDGGFTWVRARRSDGVKDADYEVRTHHAIVHAVGTTFEVESQQNDIVRVIDGEVKVDILAKDSDRVLDTVTVGVGQQITIDDATLNAYSQGQTPSVLQAVSDDFKTTDWYNWNKNEDANPTQFGYNAGFADTSESSQQSLDTSDQADSVNNTQVTLANGSVLNSPLVTSPSTSTIDITTPTFNLAGTVDTGVAKVMVEQIKDGKPDMYYLNKFKKGDVKWSYGLSASYGNMQPGENVYSVYAIDDSGNKSKPTVVTINYNKDGAATATQQTTASSDLSAPVVSTFNASKSNVVTVGVVKVEGTVKGASKIVIDYVDGATVLDSHTLGQFKAGDTTWKYFANVDGGNFKAGVNNYVIHAYDAAGNAAPDVKFTITYNKTDSTASQQNGTQQNTNP